MASKKKLLNELCEMPEHLRGISKEILLNKYEKKIHTVVRKCTLNGKPFNTQTKPSGGSSAKNDLECNHQNERDIGIEAKKYKTPDWMQCSIKYNLITNKSFLSYFL